MYAGLKRLPLTTKKFTKLFLLTLAIITLVNIFTTIAYSDNLDNEIRSLLNEYLSKYKKSELVTAISVSISLPKEEKIRNYAAGKISDKEDSPALKPNALFQIGSITKSFAAAIILQLEAEGKLNINQTIGRWLPEYPKWKDTTIKSLLNMTSGIPSYTSNPEILKKMADDIEKQWTNKEIVDAMYTLKEKTTGWNYSDTNYILVGMIIEKVTGHTFTSEIKERFLNKKNLSHTFYAEGPIPQRILDKMPRGYFYGKKLIPSLYGKDVTKTNLSLAGAAGAIVSTTEDIIHWVRMLFSGSLFPSQQLLELKELISMTSGLPVKEVTPKDPSAFGLGVGQAYTPIGGPSWFYEGTTFAHRAYYLFTPCNNIIVSIAMNSSPWEAEKNTPDNIGLLAQEIYDKIFLEWPEYKCKEETLP